MKLRRVALEGFKKFYHRREFMFGDGLNLVLGANEAGKSSLVEGIVAGLFVSSENTTDKDFLNRIIGWGEELGRVEIELEDEELGGVRIYKTYARNRSDRAMKVEFYEKGEWKELSKSKGQEVVGNLLGGLHEEVYLKTACIKEHEMGGDVGGLRKRGEQVKFGAQLEEIAIGGRIRPGEAIKRLRDALKNYSKERIEEMGREIRDKREKLLEVQNRKRRQEELRGAIEELRKEIDELRGRYEIYKVLKEKVERYREAQRGREQWEKEHKKAVEKRKLLEDSMRRAQEFMQVYSKERFSSLKEALDKTRECMKEKEKNRSLLHEKVEEIKNLQGAQKGVKLWMIVSAIVSLALLGASFLVRGVLLRSICIVLLAGVVGGGVWLAVRLKNIGRSIGRIRDEKANLEDRVGELEGKLNEIFGRVGCRDLQEIEQEFSKLDEIDRDMRELAGQVKGIVGEFEVWDEVKEKLSELEKQEREASARHGALIKEMEEILKEMGIKEEDFPRRSVEIEKEFEELEKTLPEKEKELVRLESEFNTIGDLLGDGLELEEEIAQLEEEFEEYQFRREALEKAIEAIEKARSTAFENIKDRIEEGAGRLLAEITEGGYNTVNMEFKENKKTKRTEWHVKAGTNGKVFELDMLSTGTQDQVRIAARGALSEVVFSGRKMPIILDDPFVNFDEVRLRNALKLCLDLAEYNLIDLDEEGEG